ncbi:hypothetical protein [Streptomyces sp. JJ36]|uniref:hypothetical protein n=1 Tax=Streptomyces sp. JJ36 TaxID=2736645 RepID=UPI001F46E627|nr:hypothetical protein [Streptomyces sp. JJ36]MCF6523688.1 hypothetical protein [Streptomyces sp. JJ36]
MRRLRTPGGASPALPAALGTLVVLTVLAVTGCDAAGSGVRVEGTPATPGPATTVERVPAQSTPAGTPSAEGGDGAGRPGEGSAAYTEEGEVRRDVETRMLTVLRRDPKVSRQVKQDLEPCVGDLFPVNVSHGRATGSVHDDLVVNVTSCADGVGVGTYVYRRSSNGELVNVFAAERPPVHAEITDKGLLVVTRDVFIGDEPICCPSGRDIITYVWQDGVFHEVARRRTDSASTSPAPTPREGRAQE